MHKFGNGELSASTTPKSYSLPYLTTWRRRIIGKISYRTIATGNQVIPGIATALSPDYIYVFTLFRGPAQKPVPHKPSLGLLRCPLGDLASHDKSMRWEYLGTGSQWLNWTPQSFPTDALRVVEGNITEASVVFHPGLQTWIASYTNPVFPSRLRIPTKSMERSEGKAIGIPG